MRSLFLRTKSEIRLISRSIPFGEHSRDWCIATDQLNSRPWSRRTNFLDDLEASVIRRQIGRKRYKRVGQREQLQERHSSLTRKIFAYSQRCRQRLRMVSLLSYSTNSDYEGERRSFCSPIQTHLTPVAVLKTKYQPSIRIGHTARRYRCPFRSTDRYASSGFPLAFVSLGTASLSQL